MAYTKVFTNPHPNGWDNPSERPPITADVLQAHTDAIQAIDNYLAAGGGAGGGGGGDYVLPVATKTILGGVKVDGNTITITADGTISVSAAAGGIQSTSDLINTGDGTGSRYVNESELAEIAFSGQYSDLKNRVTKTSELTNDSGFLSTIPKATTTTLGGIKLDGETLTMDTNGVVSVVGGAGGSSYLADLKDTNIAGPQEGQTLTYDDEVGLWVNKNTDLNNLEDVSIMTATIQDGDVLTYNSESSTWVNQSLDLGADSREITLAEYEALSTEEKNNDTTYFITDADNIDPGNVGTAGTLKPWLYDTENEVVIGIYNGKPLYRKYVEITTGVSKSGETIIALSDYISSIDKIVSYIGYAPDGTVLPLIYGSTSATHYPYQMCLVITVTNQIRISAGDDVSYPDDSIFTVMIEYTKTTDAEGSGANLMPYSFVQNGGSQVELYTNSASNITISNNSDMIPLVSITVPAGYYILDAHFNWNNAGFRWYTQITGEDFYAQSSGYDSAGHVVGAMQTICKLTKETTLTYSMWGDKNTTLNGAEIKALKISDIHD